MTTVDLAVEQAARTERAAVLAAVARDVRDLELAQDAVQEALLAALDTWPRTGVPERPGAWLTTVARRAALRRYGAERACGLSRAWSSCWRSAPRRSPTRPRRSPTPSSSCSSPAAIRR